jgi:sterol desaturase/sphingolipid hydroxylase (fatty acid hydroxylase superfamily)
MQEFWAEFLTKAPEAFVVLFFGYSSLLVTWPGFLWLEKITPVNEFTPRANYWLNWKITFSNLLLAPAFSAVVVVSTVLFAGAMGLPGLKLSTVELSLGVPVLDIFLQGAVIFLVACFLGDFSYYWWHRAQHTLPFLWEMHKLHHSDENLNSTTIYRSHFLEPAGQALFRGLTIGLIFDTSDASQTALAIIAGGFLPVLWDYFIHANVRIDALNRLLPIFSNPQYHWIHHSKMPEHQDKNYAIWLPVFDVLFGSFYRPRVDEYPPTGLATGERIETVWEAQTGPLVAWAQAIKALCMRPSKPTSESAKSG